MSGKSVSRASRSFGFKVLVVQLTFDNRVDVEFEIGFQEQGEPFTSTLIYYADILLL